MPQYKYPDQITPDGQTLPIRITKISQDTEIKIRGRKIRVGDIPLTQAKLNCGCSVRGIAFRVGDVVSCDNHDTPEPVASHVTHLI